MRPYRSFTSRGGAFALLVIAGLSAAAAAPAATPFLAEDFAPGVKLAGPDPQSLARFGNLLAMNAKDPAHGFEPWIYDGGTAELARLADLRPGPSGSYPRFLTALGSRLVFTADDGYRHLIYRYDPAATGAEMRALAGLEGFPYASTVMGGRAYFFAYDLGTGRLEIHETDGSAAGTTRVGELCPHPMVCSPSSQPVFAFGGAVYFNFAQALYRLTPGSPPVALRDVGQVSDYEALDAGRFVMSSCDPLCRLWVSDGSAAGTFPLEEGGLPPHNPSYLTAFNGRIYALTGDGKVASTDGTVAGTRLEPGFPNLVRRLLGALPGVLLYYREPAELRAMTAGGVHSALAQGGGSFSAGGLFGNRRVLYGSDGVVWVTDGSAAGTQPVGNVLADGEGVELGGRFYFPGLSSDLQGYGHRALYRIGLLANAHLAAELRELPLGSYPRSFAAAGGIVAAAIEPGTVEPAEVPQNFGLYRVDPAGLGAVRADPRAFLPIAVAGDQLFAAIQPFTGLAAIGAAGVVADLPWVLPASPAATDDGRLLYNDSDPGQALWQSDGTFVGTFPLFDLLPGWTPPICITFPCPEAQLPASITPVAGQVFFLADSRPEVPGPELWVLPASPEAPRFLADLPPVDPFPRLVRLPGARVAFAVPDATAAEPVTRFWVSDGTVAGTRAFLTLPGILFEPELAALGAKLLIAGRGEGHLIVADPDSGFVSYLVAADQIGPFTVVGDLAFFRAATAEEGAELWRSDGTQGGTFPIVLRPGLESALAPAVEIHDLGDGRVIFAADDGAGGNEPWLSDGSRQGTGRLADLAGGSDSSNPGNYARAGNRLFFQADDGSSGAELWAVDLEPAKAPCPADKLCLFDGRFEAQVTARVGDQVFPGRRAMASNEAGIFSFFGPDNWELMVKLLDGCNLNQSFWLFAAGATDVAFELQVKDRATGTVKTYRHQAGTPAAPIIDLGAMAVCGSEPGAPAYLPSLPIPPLVKRCADDPRSLCLGEAGRFRVKATWQTADATAQAQTLPYGSQDSGVFWFFDPANWELMVKVLDGCHLNGHHWIFAAGTTDAGWKLEIEDRITGERKTYENPAGHPSITVTDSLALGGCP